MIPAPHDPDDPGPDPMARSGRRCTAWSKSAHRRCRQLAMANQQVCYAHGGRSPQALAAAERRQVAIDAERVLDGLGLVDADPLRNPIDELERVAGQVVALKDRLVERVDAAGLDDRAGLEALERGLDRVSKLLTDMLRVGFEARQVEISERQAEILVTVIGGIVGDLGHDVRDPATKQVVARWLREAKAIEAAGVAS